MFDKIKTELLNLGLKLMSIDEKIVRIFLETRPSNVNEIVILPAVKLVMKRILNKLQNKRVNGRVYNGFLDGVKVSVIRSLVGCPNCAIAVESLKRCLNTKIIIRVDFCGGIESDKSEIKIGDTLIPSHAYCGDGTSPQYILKYPELLTQLNSIVNPIPKVQEIKAGNQTIFISKPDGELKDILLKTGNSQFPNVKEVKFWTTDALFCETEDFVESLKSIDVQGIDMESSILFLLGKLYSIRTTSILSVSDLPNNPKYDIFKSNEIHPNLNKGINNSINILIKALPRIKSTLI